MRANDTLAYIQAWEMCCQLVRDILIANTFLKSSRYFRNNDVHVICKTDRNPSNKIVKLSKAPGANLLVFMFTRLPGAVTLLLGVDGNPGNLRIAPALSSLLTTELLSSGRGRCFLVTIEPGTAWPACSEPG